MRTPDLIPRVLAAAVGISAAFLCSVAFGDHVRVILTSSILLGLYAAILYAFSRTRNIIGWRHCVAVPVLLSVFWGGVGQLISLSEGGLTGHFGSFVDLGVLLGTGCGAFLVALKTRPETGVRAAWRDAISGGIAGAALAVCYGLWSSTITPVAAPPVSEDLMLVFVGVGTFSGILRWGAVMVVPIFFASRGDHADAMSK